MPPRSRNKAFRNAILWTWWLPLLLAAVGAGGWYLYDKNVPDEFRANGRIAVVLPNGQAPDEATIREHVAFLESPIIAEKAAALVRAAYPERTLKLPEKSIEVTAGKGGLIRARATGPDAFATQAFLNESMTVYVSAVEFMRSDYSPTGEKLNRQVIPVILELADNALQKPREFVLPLILLAIGGGVAGVLIMLLVSTVWALFRPASTQASLDDIVKAASGLDAISQNVLVEWLRGRAASDVPGEHTSPSAPLFHEGA